MMIRTGTNIRINFMTLRDLYSIAVITPESAVTYSRDLLVFVKPDKPIELANRRENLGQVEE